MDLPDPFGPTTQVIPGSNRSVVADAKDLNPFNVKLFRCKSGDLSVYCRGEHWPGTAPSYPATSHGSRPRRGAVHPRLITGRRIPGISPAAPGHRNGSTAHRQHPPPDQAERQDRPDSNPVSARKASTAPHGPITQIGHG
ncbi:hypothetical protein FMUAM8_40720 [Nocardia cyriacigeorgica]|nr:hypothetical protein FMUAM8_40720 [Nocardia cyriacigeorgica]BDU07719.1 hypothetical protein FMUBM48_39820 [Nocardia cyriacigeorgica]